MPAQPDNTWSIQLLDANFIATGAKKTLAQLGIESLSFDENVMAADVWTLIVGGRALDAATLWPYGQSLIIFQPDGTRAFFGRVEPWSREGAPTAQNHIGRLVNPWWYLAQKVYEQTYKFILQWNADPTKITYFTRTTPRVVLNVLYDAVKGFSFVSTGAQIADVVNWAISQGAPIKLGTMDPAAMPMSDYQKGIFCDQVVHRMFRLEPDFVVDWDYTTTPFPTVHFRKQVSLTPLMIDLTSTTIREQVHIKERPDWQRSFVKINYDVITTNGPAKFLSLYQDWYSANGQGNALNNATSGAALPLDTESQFRGVDLFCDLTGLTTAETSETATFASQPIDITALANWKKWHQDLDAALHPDIYSVLIQAPTITTHDEFDGNGNSVPYDQSCIYELIEGQWADWIPNVNAQRVRVTATIVIMRDKGDAGLTPAIVTRSHDMTLCNLNTAGIAVDFWNNTSTAVQFAEPMPVGLAKSMWTSWQNLAIEGNFTNTEVVCGTTPISRGNSLNFKTTTPGANGQPDWRNVNALIQRISGDIAKGITKVEFGAPLHITGHELIDAARVTRFRYAMYDLNFLFGGPLPGGGNVRQGRKTHSRNSDTGGEHPQSQVVSNNPKPVAGRDAFITQNGQTGVQTWSPPNGNAAPQVVLDPAAAKGSDNLVHPVALREVKVTQIIGGVCKQRTMIVMGSLVYQAPSDPA